MIKQLKYIVISIIYSLLIINYCNSAENKILFKVNNNIITSLDIFTELQYLKIINKEFKKIEKEKAFEISRKSIIREKIKEIEIKRVIKEIEIDDKILNNIIIGYFKEFEINTITEFENFFLNKNIDPNLIKKKITLEVLWNQLIYSKYNQNIKIDKQLIKSNLSNNKKQTEFLISEILFNIDKNEDLNKKFLLIDNSIKEINFAQTALAYSISDTANKGGKLGWISESILSEQIYKKIKKLKIGEHTNPILVPGGFLILKLLDFKEVNKEIDIENEVKKIVKEKTNQQLNRFSNIYFNKVKKDILINEL
ncbi:peptidylprolyl isomerase [Pelagibacterales bacterium SAG-MED49]|nr:peptidylprolyl isomerase [Pelagibacterales bacterium SAG-MED49]